MIRINLLGLPKPKKGRRGAGAGLQEGAGGISWGILLAFLVLAIGLNAFYYKHLSDRAEDLAVRQKTAEAEALKYANVQRVYEARKKEVEAYERRIKIIDQLRKQQSGPALLLTTLGDTVDQTDGVWLANSVDDGPSVSIEGTALSTHAVANFITNLQHSGTFKNVELKDTFQDDRIKDFRAFNFTLICEKKT